MGKVRIRHGTDARCLTAVLVVVTLLVAGVNANGQEGKRDVTPVTGEPAGRGRLLAGTGPRRETSLRRAQRWLKEQQNADGSWTKEAPVTVTSLCLLSFLASAPQRDNAEFGPVARKAAAYLAAQMKALPANSLLAPKEYRGVAHGLATKALVAACIAVPAPSLELARDAGVTSILATQREHGGWTQPEAEPDDWSLMLSVCQMDALACAFRAGSEQKAVGSLPEKLEQAKRFLLRTAYRQNGFRESATAKEASVTSQIDGLYALFVLREQDSTQARAMLEWVDVNVRVDWHSEARTATGQETFPEMLDWCRLAHIMSQRHDAVREPWRDECYRQLIYAQLPDGRWLPPPPASKPSPIGIAEVKVVRTPPAEADILTTALCCLILAADASWLPSFGRAPAAPEIRPIP